MGAATEGGILKTEQWQLDLLFFLFD